MQIFSNNGATTLAVAVNVLDTTITVVDAGKFPVGEFKVTLETVDRSKNEIVLVTEVVGEVLTVVRAQEGTVATDFPVGAKVENRVTAEWLNDTAQELVTVDTKIDALTASIANLATAQAAIQSSGTMMLTTTPTQMAFTVTTPSTDSNVMTLNDAANTFTLLHNASYNWTSNVVLMSSTSIPRTITFRLVNTADNAVLLTQSATVEVAGGDRATLPISTLLTVSKNGIPVAPLTIRVEAYASGTGYTIETFNSILASGSSYDVVVVDQLDQLVDVVAPNPNEGDVLVRVGTNWVNSANIAGNAATATKLATARTIAGTSFDGSANIGIQYSNLTGLPTLGTAASKNIPATGNASSTEVVYGTDTRLSDARTPLAHTHTVADVTGLQTALDGKQATITGAATTITTSNLTASRAMVTDASGKIAAHGTVSATELGYLDGVTSAIQLQLSTKASLTGTETLTNKTIQGGVFANGYTEEVFAVSGNAPALSPTNGSVQTWVLGAFSATPTFGTFDEGQSMTLMIDDGIGQTVTWPAITWKTDGGVAPTLNTTGYTVIVLWKVGSTVYGARVGDA